eukprot:CAMPEP_0175323304 /NCGR_PEP_ID=MMETSP0093-20121207/72914_1 /TAXON_ID=311494 /ORGANISM="Alexandrium monilatum, Strain CCMP3105" /LENGTH=192 /DNA_ID=CAMNT_0016620205 /DNA_START=17 /DNA_END=592 /DNA_ORIENTATION=-
MRNRPGWGDATWTAVGTGGTRRPSALRWSKTAPAGLGEVEHRRASRVHGPGARRGAVGRLLQQDVLVGVQLLGRVARALLLQPPLGAQQGRVPAHGRGNKGEAAEVADDLLDDVAGGPCEFRAALSVSQGNPPRGAEAQGVVVPALSALPFLLQQGRHCALRRSEQLITQHPLQQDWGLPGRVIPRQQHPGS